MPTIAAKNVTDRLMQIAENCPATPGALRRLMSEFFTDFTAPCEHCAREAWNTKDGYGVLCADCRAEREDIDACPGCGCHEGDGRTPGCTHPDGCGYHDGEPDGYDPDEDRSPDSTDGPDRPEF